ncbi:MAG: aspartate 1-decarboxylase [Bacteroidetes bacterium]|nr:MAG: aspartate 1-decarboxylase [Bacteroidota bacterium]
MKNYIHVLKSKIHRATVTQAELDYFGSITIDKNLMDATDIKPFEKVLITNMRNGARLETYALEGTPGTGEICMNGPSAHLVSPEDEILIMTFAMIPEEMASNHIPKVIFPADRNTRWDVYESQYH